MQRLHVRFADLAKDAVDAGPAGVGARGVAEPESKLRRATKLVEILPMAIDPADGVGPGGERTPSLAEPAQAHVANASEVGKLVFDYFPD